MVVSVDNFLKNHNYRLNRKYYLERVLNAAMRRVLDAVGVSIDQWFNNMPKQLNKKSILLNDNQFIGKNTSISKGKVYNYNLEHYYNFKLCILCQNESKFEICSACISSA